VRKGLTLIEVLLALSLLSLVLLALNASLVSNLGATAEAGLRTQAVQILNYLGRRVVGGELLPAPGTPLVYGYGSLKQSFPELTRESYQANPDLYRASIRNLGLPSWAQSLNLPIHEYEIQVCFRKAGGESCTRAHTFSAIPGQGEQAPPLPGIN